MSDITPRQQRILDVIAEAVRTRGYPPTVREIGSASSKQPTFLEMTPAGQQARR